ncbi:MAG: DNA recombination protein RmuC [Alphaproteobacteria bacterium]|jgi:DNA recombination protein RmuC
MDSTLLVVALFVVAAAIIAAALILARRESREPAGPAPEIAALAERLGMLAEQQATAQAQTAQALQAQERALAETLEKRLTAVTARIGETLEKTGKANETTLGELRDRLVRIDAAQKNIADLSSQMVGLQEILSNKQARGAFGEIQLRDLVESVLPPSAYSFQQAIGDNKRVDCLLVLPNPPGPIGIDAKFPLESYRALREAEGDDARRLAARAFATDVLKHVDDIAQKYIVPGETAEAAMMFLPSEAVYAELHANFGDVVEKSYRARVFIVSPTTLWATLNTVRAVMKDVRMKEAAGVIQKEVLTMMQDVARLDDRVGKLQRHFDQSADDIRQIRISTEKVTKRGERIGDLQLGEDEAGGEAAAEDGTADLLGGTPRLRSVE